jgi:hypothetical protein
LSRESEASICFITWARQTLVAVSHVAHQLGRQDIAVARTAGELLAEHGFGGAPAIDIGGIDEIDPEIEGPIQTGLGLVRLDADAIGQPRAEGDLRDLEVAGAELTVLHAIIPN